MASKFPSLARRANGFTIMEATIALGIVAFLAVIVSQCVVWNLHERARFTASRAALELAANILEAARAQPWEQLDKSWADAQTVPSEMAELLPQGKVVVTLETIKETPLTKRVIVEVRWQFEPHLPACNVQIPTLLSARQAKKDGGKP
jgi:Tfp pilus assembly protein PilE